MQSAEIEKAKNLIQQSSLLSAPEKAEWLQLLPDMSERQISDLVKILIPSPSTGQHIPNVQVNIKQKEIGTSIPFYEKEISAPAADVQVNTQPLSKSVRPSDPTELQNRVENIVRELQHKKPEEIHLRQAYSGVEESNHNYLDPSTLVQSKDFEKFSGDQLHYKDPAQELQKILVAVAKVGKHNQTFDIIQWFEKSQLYRTYIDMGLALLNEVNPDRDAAYDSVVAIKKNKGQGWMSKEEFEAFADFRNRLEQMI